MILFDVPMDGVLTAGTPYALIDSCCTKAGITLATGMEEFQGFANGLTAFTIPSDSKIETCRDLIMWVCQATGTFARMNRLGQLEIVPVTAGSSVKTISKQERFTSDVSDFEVKITQVNMKVGETEYSQGTAGMTMVLEENPLLVGKSEAEINAALAEILDQVTEAEYTPYNLTCAGDPALQAGDWVKLTGVSNINGPEFVYTRNSVAYHPDTGEEIPEDTPVFVDFAGGRKGSLMVEGTENTEDPTNWGGWTLVRIAQVSEIGFCEHRFTAKRDVDGAFVHKSFNFSGTTRTFQVLMRGFGSTIGKRVRWQCSAEDFYGEQVELSDIYKPVVGTITFTDDSRPVGISCPDTFRQDEQIDIKFRQIEQKPYSTPFQIGTRADPTKRIVLPEALPSEFGIGIAFKPLHTDPGVNRRLLEIITDPYDINNRIYFTLSAAGTGRMVCVHAREGKSLSNNVDNIQEADIITGLYFHQFATGYKIYLQKNGGTIQTVEKAGLPISGLKVINLGFSVVGALVRANAVLADFVLHDRPEDIDPEGYLSAIPGGGGE
jgi:hypothetical protein